MSSSLQKDKNLKVDMGGLKVKQFLRKFELVVQVVMAKLKGNHSHSDSHTHCTDHMKRKFTN